MAEVILLRYGEIFLKGKNFGYFEKILINNIKKIITPFDVQLIKTNGRLFVENFKDSDKQNLIEALTKIFGLVSLSIAQKVPSNVKDITSVIKKIKIESPTFKVETKRADKTFPVQSYIFSGDMGAIILENNKAAKVDVHNPQIIISIDIREDKNTYIYHTKIPCAGGLPVGCSGKTLLLLSGGIDSPVAGYMMAKRGLKIDAIHFESYPYTSEQAKQKVISLAQILKQYVGEITLYIVPFTKIQESIVKNCDNDYLITIIRRFMMEIAERTAQNTHSACLTTGENLGQVASQTVEGITMSDNAAKTLPVFRPLISFDKTEIMDIAKKIGTFQTSILPYEDCCSVFMPDSPATKPKLGRVHFNEKFLDKEELISEAISKISVIKI